jgi:hypothetical protein
MMPTPLQDPYGQSFTRARGIVKDWLNQQVRAAVLQRMPSLAASDSLGAIGTERGILQGTSVQLSPPETSSAYAGRVIDAWNLWTLGGTAWGMLKAFAAQGYFPQIVCANGLIYSVNGSLVLSITKGPPLTFDPPFWNVFFVWFGTKPTSWTSPAAPPTTSTVPSIYDVRLMRDGIINKWKRSVDLCVGIAVLTAGSGGVLGSPGLVLGGGQTLGGATVVWYGPHDTLTLGMPPDLKLGSGYTLGEQV